MAGRTDSGSSITNVAATAGVSIATVSRVLSGKRGKDDDIARRVREAAKQLGYSVNYAASALRSDVTKTIGLVIPSATEPFSAQLLDEIEPTIDTESQQLLLGIGATQEAQAERIESLANRHVDGLIVVPAAGTDLAGTLNQYANTLPIVQICGRQTAPRVSVVGIDENAAMEAIVKHLAEQASRPPHTWPATSCLSNRRNCSPHSTRICALTGLPPAKTGTSSANVPCSAVSIAPCGCSTGRSCSRRPWSAPTMRSRSA